MKRVLCFLRIWLALAPLQAVLADGFTVTLHETTQALDSICGGSGHGIADGTPIEIWWDLDPAGVGPEDQLAPLCASPPACATGPDGTVNYNTFVFNGSAEYGISGQFETASNFISSAVLANPCRFYLRVCLPAAHYTSNPFTLTSGPQDVEIAGWSCYAWTCGACDVPPAPTGFSATDSTSCAGVALQWTYPGGVSGVDKFIIYRGGVILDSVAPAERSYNDAAVAPSIRFEYGVAARRNCGSMIRMSVTVTDFGSRYPSPPLANNVSATTTLCDSVAVTWTYLSSAGIDSFIIKRDNVRVGAVRAQGTPGLRRFAHLLSTILPGMYTVTGRNPVCGEGTASAQVSGHALLKPDQPGSVQATDLQCDSTIITWADVATETGYFVYRSNSDGTGPLNLTSSPLPANTVRYKDIAGQTTVTYRYWIVAQNSCGTGLPSVFDYGSRITSPGITLNVNASDSAYCGYVNVTWSNLTLESGYKIVRTLGLQTDTVGTVGADTLTFNDSSAVPGNLYLYKVRAFNTCGNGNISGGNAGSVRNLPVQAGGLMATTTECSGVNLTWQTQTNIDSFILYRDTTRIGAVVAGTLTFSDTEVTDSLLHNYSVAGKNPCGMGPASTAVPGRRPPVPDRITGLAASNDLCDVVALSWQDVAGEDSFEVRRNGVRLGTTLSNVTSYQDGGAVPGVSYVYTVLAYNHCGAGALSGPASGSRVQAPGRPLTIAATDSICDGVRITWSDVALETGYLVKRNGSVIGLAGRDTTSYMDYPAFGTFSYSVQAFNDCGLSLNSPATNGARKTVPVVSALNANSDICHTIALTWTASSNTDLIRIYRNSELIDSVLPAHNPYVDTLAFAGSYFYYLVGVDECGQSEPSNTALASIYGVSVPPTGLTFSDNHCDRITLSWTPAQGSFRTYRIYRNGILLDSTTSVQFNDPNVLGGVDYNYYVTALNDTCGESVSTGVIEAAVTEVGTPLAPAAVICAEGSSVRLSWSRIRSTEADCPVAMTGYEIYGAPGIDGPFTFLAFTTDSTWLHLRAAQFARMTYYKIIGYSGDLSAMNCVREGMKREDVERVLQPR